MWGPSQDLGGAPSGIPTVYRGVQYRSRLEAKWAAFFDLLGWPYQYEPFDLGGWIPDFMLTSGPKPVLVEVKPIYEFSREAAEKVGKSRTTLEILFVGCILFDSEDPADSLGLGWLGVPYGDEPRPDSEWVWREAVFGDWSYPPANPPVIGFTDWEGGWMNRVGRGAGKYYWRNNEIIPYINGLWNRAGNLVQWRGVQNRGV
jgi:hypothetical protein